ncbi:MAG: site-specific integrase [Betaproteobacteria bacterium]|nr:site-specific integrase [Betaproteobacteria bacterium]
MAYVERLAKEGGKDIKAKKRRIELHLMPFFGQMSLPAISIADIERYKLVRLAELAVRGGHRVRPKDASKLALTRPGTVNRELAALSHLLHMAVEWGWISHVPVKVRLLQDEARRIDYLTTEECRRLLDAAKADDNQQIYPFILIGLKTAMRRMEILRIRREHVDLAGRTIFIPKAKAGMRMQPITGPLAEFLEGYLAALPKDTPWLFPSPTSAAGHTTDVRKAFRRAVVAAGPDPDRILRHALRHTAITHMVQALVNLPTVKIFSGHKTLAMVERYAHASAAHIQASLDRLEAQYEKKD